MEVGLYDDMLFLLKLKGAKIYIQQDKSYQTQHACCPESHMVHK